MTASLPLHVRFLRLSPMRALVRILAPLFDRLTRAWVFSRRYVLPELAAPGGGALAPLVRDELETGLPRAKTELTLVLEEWFAAKPEDLEPLLERILERTNVEGRRRVFELVARDGSGRRLERLVEAALGRATSETKQRFYGWVEDRSAADEQALFYAERNFDWIRREIEKHKGPLTGMRILELGPGYTLATGLLFYVHGAASYVGADNFPIAARASSLYRRLRAHLERPILVPVSGARRAEALGRFDGAVRLDGAEAAFDETKVACRYPIDAAALPFPDGSFDVVFSMASFEHFKDPVAAIRECARVTANGGLGLHQIDFRDHRDFERPLDFLRYPDDEWDRLYTNLFWYTNRLRKGDFERAFAGAGLALRGMDVNMRAPFDPARREGLAPRFRDRPADDLEVLSALFVVAKPS